MRLKYIVFLLFVSTSLIVNFNMPKKIIDKIQMVTVAGYDYVSDDKIRGTVVVPTYGNKGQIINLIYSNTASMIYENRSKLNHQASEDLLNAKLEVVLYSKKLAAEGLSDYTDYLLRDPNVGTGLFLGIVKGSAHKLLKSFKSHKGIGISLSDMFEHNIADGHLPRTNLRNFSYSLKSKTLDPFLPMLSLKNGKPRLTGIALFDGDKYVGNISLDKAFIFKMLKGNVNDGTYYMDKEKYKVSVRSINASRDVIVKNSRHVVIDIQFKGVVREFTGKSVMKKKQMLSSDLRKSFKRRAKKLIKRLQKMHIDPLGIEEFVQSNVRSYSGKRFEQNYSDMTIKVNITIKLTEPGTRR